MIGNTEKIYPLWGNLGLLVLRLFVAYLVIKSGYGKLFTEGRIEGFSGYLTSLGVPFPLISAYLAALTEFFAPMFYVIGFGTRLASIPLVVLRENIAPKSIGLHSSRLLDIQVQCNLWYAWDSPHLQE